MSRLFYFQDPSYLETGQRLPREGGVGDISEY